MYITGCICKDVKVWNSINLLVKCKIVHITSLVLCGCTLPYLVSLLLDCSCQVVSLEFWDFQTCVTITPLLRVNKTFKVCI